MKPTYEELQTENAALKAENATLKAEVAELRALVIQCTKRIADLESQLKKNSKNSSKPPSSDQKANLPAEPKKEKRPFHPGASRQLMAESEVTSRTERRIDACPRCRSKMEMTGKVEKWQQIELPEIKPSVHQWDLYECRCPRCELVAIPQLEENEKYLLGPRLEAFTNLCLGRFRMSHRMAREFITTMVGVDLSQGLISKIKERAAKALADPHQKLMEKILTAQEPIYVDATGWRHKGINEHAVVIRTQNLIVFKFIRHQNKETFKELLAGRNLRLVTDRGLAVADVDTRTHQHCLTHLLRNLQGLAEHSTTTSVETEQIGEVYDSIQQLFVDKHRMNREEIGVRTWRQYGYELWRHIEDSIEELLKSNPGKKVARFFRKMQKGGKYFKVYLRHPEYPMTNNLAEEALRSLVIARKLCFGTRSEYGKNWRASIQSCMETLHRNGLSILSFVSDAIRAYRCGSPCSSIFST